MPELSVYPPLKAPSTHTIPWQVSAHLSQLYFPSPLPTMLEGSSELRLISKSMASRTQSCILCRLLCHPVEHDHVLSNCKHSLNPFANDSGYALWKSQLRFPRGTCYACGCPQHVSFSLPVCTRSSQHHPLQLKYTNDKGTNENFHPYNNVSHCGWRDTFLVVAWLVRKSVRLQAELVNIFPRGLDYKHCPFEVWLTREERDQQPANNLLYLYMFFIARL